MNNYLEDTTHETKRKIKSLTDATLSFSDARIILLKRSFYMDLLWYFDVNSDITIGMKQKTFNGVRYVVADIEDDWDIEIIGNIHENPELLKGAGDD